jgi:nucleoside-diphosphate-sugar epimerase
MSTAFVTGGSGFVGGRLIERLVGDGWTVKALARSDRSADAVRKLGAEPVKGDLDDVGAMREGARGADVFHHAAAKVEQWGPWEDFARVNVAGTHNALRAAREAGVPRFVHVGTEAALMAGKPLVDVDERAPLRPDSPAPYSASKALAEQAVRQAGTEGFETVVVRPRFVWGAGDTTLLPEMVAMAKSGQLKWIGGGGNVTDVTHVDNVVEGLVLAADKGRPGAAYFVTDDDRATFREFVSELLETQGVEPPTGSVPVPVATLAATIVEAIWRRRGRDDAPLTRFVVWVSSQECTIDTSLAHSELGYAPVKSRAEGMEELRREAAAA